MKKIIFYILSMFTSISFAQGIYTQDDVNICTRKFEFASSKNLADKPINEVIVEIGKSFIGTEYAAHSLEQGEKEELVVHLTGLDCYTFLESSLVFARCIKLERNSFEDFRRELIKVRYRNGVIDEYPSRLHYFSDWIYDVSKRRIVKNITKEIGGIPYHNDVNFMSTHPSSYQQLVTNPNFIEKMDLIEKMINMRDYYYIPKNKIESIEKDIQSGDIIGITTDIAGLDIIHTGIAVRLNDGRIHFMHSPNVGHKVEITKNTLVNYLKTNKHQTGIMVVRAAEPNNN